MAASVMEDARQILAQFKNADGDLVGTPVDVPISIDRHNLELLCNTVLGNAEEAIPKGRRLQLQEENVSYDFTVSGVDINETLEGTISVLEAVDTEKCIEICYIPQAVFKVKAVTRCSSTLTGHTEAVIAVSFSPNGRQLASGSGDSTVRLWDINTETPHVTCKGHSHWILVVSWSHDGSKLASGCKKGEIYIWDPKTGKQLGKTLSGHTQWITWISWEPIHIKSEGRLLASSSKDCTIRIWDANVFLCVRVLGAHTHSVTCVKWGGEGLLYSSSHDRTIKVWRASDGVLCRTLQGHGHWVNVLALNTDYILRLGANNPQDGTFTTKDLTEVEKKSKAESNYKLLKGNNRELLVSGSDDFTLFLWNPSEKKAALERMTGHQQLVNDVKFSPDMTLVASASFDKSIKLWSGKSGKYICTFRGHVSPVYQISWSADSRLLCSGSSDSTLKVWNIRARKLLKDLPGHSDEVFTVDWSPSGEKVASGGRDRVMKLWCT